MIAGKAFGELDQRRFASGIRRAAGHADLPELRSDVDDRATSRLADFRYRVFAHQESAGEIRSQRLIHCSRVRVSTVPSGVTAAATLTSVVSEPKASTAWRT